MVDYLLFDDLVLLPSIKVEGMNKNQRRREESRGRTRRSKEEKEKQTAASTLNLSILNSASFNNPSTLDSVMVRITKGLDSKRLEPLSIKIPGSPSDFDSLSLSLSHFFYSLSLYSFSTPGSHFHHEREYDPDSRENRFSFSCQRVNRIDSHTRDEIIPLPFYLPSNLLTFLSPLPSSLSSVSV